MSLNKLSISSIKKMPVVLGEVDVLKSLLLLPELLMLERDSGFNVRGGGADQNLILLDEATIFNFPFFSLYLIRCHQRFKIVQRWNSANYGGRVSFYLSKDGSSKEFHVNGGIGLISSRILVEGPIVKDKGAFN
jgi:hypothetical protein